MEEWRDDDRFEVFLNLWYTEVAARFSGVFLAKNFQIKIYKPASDFVPRGVISVFGDESDPAFLDTVFCLVIKWGILVKPAFLCSNVSVSSCLNLFRAYG